MPFKKFSLFPRKQKQYVICSSAKAFKHDLFKSLFIQCASKNSLISRFSITSVSYALKCLTSKRIEVPEQHDNYLGLVKKDKTILFELSGEHIKVWKKGKDNTWHSSEFLGYPLISEYTLKEIKHKQGDIEKALNNHISAYVKSNLSHGDFTHFNILVDNSTINFIDHKDHNFHVILDLFYFYAYLHHNFKRCVTVSNADTQESMKLILAMIKTLVHPSWIDNLNRDISTYDLSGLVERDIASYQKQFTSKIFI